MAIYFELQALKSQQHERQDRDGGTANGGAVVGDSEETPLLRPAG
jgi:hypothetical protein